MNRPLTRSILITVILFWALQAGLFCVLAAANGISLRAQWPFFPTSAACHALALVFLMVFREDFVVEPSGRRLERVNLANILTLIRISTLPTILFLIIGSMGRPILPATFALTAAVFLTDLLDGFVSRAMNQGTRVGRMLDSISDYFLLAVLSIVLALYGLIQAWYFWIVLGRLLFQAVGMSVFFLAGRPIEPKPTIFGKVTVASTMIVFGLSILNRLLSNRIDRAFVAIEIAAACLVALSVIDKATVFIKHIPRRSGARQGE